VWVRTRELALNKSAKAVIDVYTEIEPLDAGTYIDIICEILGPDGSPAGKTVNRLPRTKAGRKKVLKPGNGAGIH
jgi:hypothetical protein